MTTLPFKTPRRRVLGLGTAHAGTEHFWVQRLTAIANLFLVTALVVLVILCVRAPYDQARAIIGSPVAAILLVLLVVSAVNHMRIGMQVIIEDYVHGGAKVAAIVANYFFAAVIGVAVVYAVLKIGLGF